MSDQTKQVNQSRQTEPNTPQKEETPKQTPVISNNYNIMKLLEKAGDSNVGALLQKFQPVLDAIGNIIQICLPYLMKAWDISHKIYYSLPLDLIYALVGLLLVFFGGIFCLVVAAAETFYMTGYKQIKELYFGLKEEFEIILEASRKDNLLDENKDGIEDVKQITVRELIARKTLLFFRTCKDPQRIMSLIPTVVTVVISVIAVLKVQFAKVIALGHTIGEALIKSSCYFLVPALGAIVPSDYQKWIVPIIEFICKIIAITIAWFIQRVISSVQSAIRGGLMFSRNILNLAKEKGVFPGYNEDDYWDEILGWSVAAIGIYFQITLKFGLPFPLNFILFPFSIMEGYLQWAVSE